jgi:hypothetical protein
MRPTPGEADKSARGGILRESFVSNSGSLAQAEDDGSHPSELESYSNGSMFSRFVGGYAGERMRSGQ